MQVSAATFTDPAMRSQLKQYYDSKIASASEALRARGDVTLPKEISYTDSDGKVHKSEGGGLVSAEKMIGALATFDQWIDFQIEEYKEGGWAERLTKMPTEEQMLAAYPHPDSKSDVRAAFSNNGELMVSIDKNGGVLNINGAERYTEKAEAEANKRGLVGQARVDFLTKEIEAAFSARYPDLQIDKYTSATTPTNREFAEEWYDYDVDENYKMGLADLKAQAASNRALQKQTQDYLREIQTYLLSFQEVA